MDCRDRPHSESKDLWLRTTAIYGKLSDKYTVSFKAGAIADLTVNIVCSLGVLIKHLPEGGQHVPAFL